MLIHARGHTAAPVPIGRLTNDSNSRTNERPKKKSRNEPRKYVPHLSIGSQSQAMTLLFVTSFQILLFFTNFVVVLVSCEMARMDSAKRLVCVRVSVAHVCEPHIKASHNKTARRRQKTKRTVKTAKKKAEEKCVEEGEISKWKRIGIRRGSRSGDWR